jgi:NAD(P)-dependent dehydrogenase (short-subunit alcohol dehydrogenase family)
MSQTPNQYAVQDLATQYAQPKFEDQPQSAPGLARDMVSRPDHGETSYRGFGRAAATFTHALAKQVAKRGIRINAMASGPVWTPLQPSGGQLQEKIPDLGSEVPMERPGQPAEMASVYGLLASQESSYVTGEIYGVTGGNHLP